jgi:hypothetical protein
MNVVTRILDEFKLLGFQVAATTVEDIARAVKKASLLFPIHTLKIVGAQLQCARLTLSNLEKKMSGNHGTMFSCERQQKSVANSVYLKVSHQHAQTLLVEGLLQSMAYSTLGLYGFPNAVPRVFDVLNHPLLGYCITQEKNNDAQLFADYLSQTLRWGEPMEENDHLVFSVIVQVATYLAILEKELRLNHRDLTGTNVLMIMPNQQVMNTVTVGAYQWTLRATQQAILIDFGFACTGSADGTIVVQAGQFLPKTDFCPKQGRDLFLFFASLWNAAEFRSSLTVQGQQLFTKWLRETSSTTEWSEWLEHDDKDNMKSMYLLCCAEHFQSPMADSIAVIADIAEVYPHLVTFSTIG